MPRFTWSGLPSFPWNRREDAVEGLVLSGGGSRASFQIGALRYLYRRAGIAPTVMVGTSAGSVLVAMLAQFADADDQADAVDLVERLWTSMRTQSDMFTERVWFATLRDRGQEWFELINEKDLLRPREPRPEPRGSVFSLSRLAQSFGHRDDEPGDEDERGRSRIAPLSPQAEVLQLATTDEQPRPGAWTTADVMQLMSVLPRLRGAPADLATIWAGAEASRSMYHPGPILAALLDEENFQAKAVTWSGVTTRIAFVALESGELRFMREDGRIVDRDDELVPGTTRHDLSRGVLASCSIPAVFPPVEMDGEYYVDGGVRENVPVEMAIGKLGVNKAYVIGSTPTDPTAASSFATKSMLSIAFRATELLTEETERDELAYARNAGAMVIEPELNVHSSLTVDPGLIRINIDYGWLRAAEQHLEMGPLEVGVHRALIAERLAAHALEAEHFLGEGTVREDALRELARIKLEIRSLAARVRESLLPPDAAGWWDDYEQHPTAPTTPPPWITPDSEQFVEFGD